MPRNFFKGLPFLGRMIGNFVRKSCLCWSRNAYRRFLPHLVWFGLETVQKVRKACLAIH